MLSSTRKRGLAKGRGATGRVRIALERGDHALQELDGEVLREMFIAATSWLQSHVEAINALNVFPVPDGDTGTNMLLTMRSALKEVPRAQASDLSATASALAKGSLMGARGNSGVILSQILRGFSQSFQDRERVGTHELADAFQRASDCAYRAVIQPVEGTILTVIREVAQATQASVEKGERGLLSAVELASSTAKASVAMTPSLLDILKESGVVDAGGQGLAVLLEGMVRYLKGSRSPESAPVELGLPSARTSADPLPEQRRYGFCTEFFIERCRMDPEELRARLGSMGESLLVLGDQGLVKVHLHTFEPDPVLSFAGSVGSLNGVKIDNIDAQHQRFIAKQAPSLQGSVGVLAVVSGDGLADLFRSLGAAGIVPGGQSMNPSTEEVLRGAMEIPAEKVIILPNNANVIPGARQAQQLAKDKELFIVPTEDLPQGVAAMMAFHYESDAPANVSAMGQAWRSMKSGGVTRAVRRARVNGKLVAKGKAIGLAHGKLVVAESDVGLALESLLDHLGVEAGSAVTLYYGAAISPQEAEEAKQRLARRFPAAEVQAIWGGQPHYHYLLAVE